MPTCWTLLERRKRVKTSANKNIVLRVVRRIATVQTTAYALGRTDRTSCVRAVNNKTNRIGTLIQVLQQVVIAMLWQSSQQSGSSTIVMSDGTYFTRLSVQILIDRWLRVQERG